MLKVLLKFSELSSVLLSKAHLLASSQECDFLTMAVLQCFSGVHFAALFMTFMTVSLIN